MVPPKLYEAFDRPAAIAAFGIEQQARVECDGQWVIWPEVAVCLAETGEGPGKSHFTSGASFAWVAEKPYRVGTEALATFVPAEVVGTEGLKRALWLFVRPSRTGDYRFIGQLQASHVQQAAGKENYGEAHFALRPALPSEVWRQLGGFDPGDLNHAAVDAALATLPQTATAAERLGILRTLVRYWHGDISADDGLPVADLSGLDLPPVLRWWYRFAGRRKDILSGHNILLSPAHLRNTPEGLLVFYGENQWCYEWATLRAGDDPQVFGREGGQEPWKPEGITLSEHLILACLFEGIMCHCRYGASAAWLTDEALAPLVKRVPEIASKGWRWCGQTRFFAGYGVFMYTMYNGDLNGRPNYSVWIGAKTEKPLQFLKPLLDDAWEYVAV